MIETFSDLAKLLDDGWRITGISADSDGERQTFRFEVEARRTTPEEELHALLVRLQETQVEVLARRGEFSVAEIDEAIQDVRRLRGTLAEGYARAFVLPPPAITPEGWEIGSGFAEFLHSVGHGNLDMEEQNA